MKKLVFTLGLACLFMAACNNTPKQPEQTQEPVQEETTEVVEEKHECPMGNLKAEFANWESMTEEAKAELNKKAAAVFAEMELKKAEMKAAGEEVCKEIAEMTEEQKQECEAKCAEMKAAWDNFANMSVDEQKDLIMKRLEGCGNHGNKPCCKHEGEQGDKSCCKQEGEQPAAAE